MSRGWIGWIELQKATAQIGGGEAYACFAIPGRDYCYFDNERKVVLTRVFHHEKKMEIWQHCSGLVAKGSYVQATHQSPYF